MILKIYRDTVVANGIEEVYDYIHHDGAAAVLPVTKDGKILMVRQYRNALDRFTLEIPAGKLDAPDEPKIECAARELEEETGFRSENLEFLMTVNTTVAFCGASCAVNWTRITSKKQKHSSFHIFGLPGGTCRPPPTKTGKRSGRWVDLVRHSYGAGPVH